MKYQSSRKLRWTSGMLGHVRRRPLAAVDVDEEVAGDPEREEVDRRAADDLVGSQVDGEEGVDERERRPRRAAAQRSPSAHELSLSAPRIPKNAPGEHHPLEADVHDAAPLGEDAAHRREGERRREAEHRGDQRRPDDDLLEIADARAGGEVAERRSRARRPTTAPQPSRRSPRLSAPMPSARPSTPITTGTTGSRIESGGSATQKAAMPTRMPSQATARALRGAAARSARSITRSPPRLVAGRLLPSADHATRISTSAPTKRTTSPWISSVRLEASSGRKISGSRLRVDVPVTSAANRSAERPTPIARVPPQQRDGDADEGDRRRQDVVRVDPELPAERCRCAPASPANMPEIAIARK